MRKLILQLRLQDSVRRAIAALEGPVVVTIERQGDGALQRFLDMSYTEQLLLLDYPDPERTLPGDLLFAKEPDFPRSKIDSSEPIEIGRSAIFSDISTRFVSSIGKLRLLVRADQQNFLRHALSRDDLARLVSEAVRYATLVDDPSKDQYFLPKVVP